MTAPDIAGCDDFSVGFGFVTFSTEEAADNAIRSFPGEIAGRAVSVKRAEPKASEGGPAAFTDRFTDFTDSFLPMTIPYMGFRYIHVMCVCTETVGLCSAIFAQTRSTSNTGVTQLSGSVTVFWWLLYRSWRVDRGGERL